ncbi:hypothetical protein ABZT26_02970 [Streptomyces sp. NPDC005395]|uniref:hypothetical protein n=1 Tax=Streptomyces sp. NPDC005395 TaxID=3157042 RepID=UPI0033ABD2FD
MSYQPTPPSPQDAVVGLIDGHQRNLGARFHSEHQTSGDTVGRFTNVAGATVEVVALAKFSRDINGDRQRSVAVGAAAKCFGFGCATPDSGESFTGPVPLDDNKWDTAAGVMPLLKTAAEWAQAHAEKCRAQPYTGR